MTTLRVLQSLLTLLTVAFFYCPASFQAEAQYIQGYKKQFIPDANNANNGAFLEQRFWRASMTAQFNEVMDLLPEVVFLEYNCQYMVVCQ